MGLHKRSDIGLILENIERGEFRKIYLCFGERFLCQQAADQIEQKLLAIEKATVHGIDGSTEDNGSILARILSFSLLPGLQLYRVTDSRLFLSRDIGSATWDKAFKAHQGGKTKAALRHLTQLLSIGSIKSEGTRVFSEISPGQWQKLFGFSHPDQDLSWADQLIQEATAAPAHSAEDITARLIDAIENGFPAHNLLLLSAENVDKRKKIFTTIKKHGEIIDCSIAEGASRTALNEQRAVIRELADRTLKSFEKKMEPNVLDQLFGRVGFHPVAVVNEVEKLCLFVDDRQQITGQDLDLMVGRTREDAIFELTEALGRKNRPRALTILGHLLEDGIHELAVIASLRNFLRRLLIFRALQGMATPFWHKGMSANEFQNNYLPVLKETGEWPDLLKGHPYALYMSFTKAAEFSSEALKESLALLLKAEFRLKSTGLPPRVVLEELLVTLTGINRPEHGSKTAVL